MNFLATAPESHQTMVTVWFHTNPLKLGLSCLLGNFLL